MDANQDKYVALLKEAVAIKSVSAWPECRPEIRRMINWTKEVQCSLPIITSQNAGLFIWNGLYSEVFLIQEKKHLCQNHWLLLGGGCYSEGC